MKSVNNSLYFANFTASEESLTIAMFLTSPPLYFSIEVGHMGGIHLWGV